MSQHHGFGNIDIERLHNGGILSPTTGLEASGKFKDKLELKQRKIEVSKYL